MKLFFILVVCFSAFSCSQRITHDTLESQLDKLFAKEFSSPEEPGGAVLVKKGNKIMFLKGYGLADINSKEKITENTIFNTGSISKTFVSNGILILNERGLLSLEDPLSQYFDDFDNPEIAEKVTIKHLLSHTSGLPDLRKVSENVEFYLTAKDEENFEPLKRTKSLHFQPGQKFQYSNPAFNGLALIIEQLTHQPWQEFIAEQIFEPSGMENSKITNGSYPESGVAHAYIKNEQGQYQEYDYGEVPTFAAAGNGGVWSSVLELAKYEDAIQKSTFLSKELIVESRIPFVPNNWSDTVSPRIGYSWFTGEQQIFRSENNFKTHFVYHTGSQGGFRAFHLTIPEKDILFIGLFNRPLTNFSQLLIDSVTLFEKHHWLE